MPKSCIICNAVASLDLELQYCAQCQSALYCSKACQREDWKKQHKKICKLLNVGHGDMQLRADEQINRTNAFKEQFERGERSLDEGMKQFFKLFEESTFEGSWAAAKKMKKYAKRQTKLVQQFLLFHSVHSLVYSSNSEMLSWPNSPFLVMLQFVETSLHHLAFMADPFNYSTHKNQLILANQLIEHGANVNALSTKGETPLHGACHGDVVTNLDFVELLLVKGANSNAQDPTGRTPLMFTIPHDPGAAKFLLNWPTTDTNKTDQSGASFLVMVRSLLIAFSNAAALPDDSPEQVKHQFLIQRWTAIEEMLVERGAM
jgi:hypothetical protein